MAKSGEAQLQCHVLQGRMEDPALPHAAGESHLIRHLTKYILFKFITCNKKVLFCTNNGIRATDKPSSYLPSSTCMRTSGHDFKRA